MPDDIKRYTTEIMRKAPKRRPKITTWFDLKASRRLVGQCMRSWKVGMYLRKDGKVKQEKELVKLEMCLEKRFERRDPAEDVREEGGSSISICSSSCRRPSVDLRSSSSLMSRSRLERADSTDGDSYPFGKEALRFVSRSRPCLSASSLISSGPSRRSEKVVLEEIASS